MTEQELMAQFERELRELFSPTIELSELRFTSNMVYQMWKRAKLETRKIESSVMYDTTELLKALEQINVDVEFV